MVTEFSQLRSRCTDEEGKIAAVLIPTETGVSLIMYRSFIVKVVVAIALAIAAIGPLASSQPEARDVLVRFCELDAKGGQLTPRGRQEIIPLFVKVGTPRLDRIIVVQDFVVSHPAFKNDRAAFYVEISSLVRLVLRWRALPAYPS